jgi:hypothetical protein
MKGGEMTLVLDRLRRPAAILVLLALLALAAAPGALTDDWARDEAGTVAREALDPAIRAAIDARLAARSAVPSPASSAVASVPDQGFAWGDAFIGAAVGVAGMCVAFVCVTLVRHDGRLRSA